MSILEFHQQVCVVTGASKNIGARIALSLAEQGATVVVHYYRDRTSADGIVQQIHAMGLKAIAAQADLRKPAEAENLIETTLHHFSKIDLLVNNLGVFVIKSLFETTIADWHEMIDSNLNSAFYCSHYALRSMREHNSGHIVFIGSGKADSVRARQNACPYGIAKTGVVLLAKTIAREEGPRGIRANVINPGAIQGGWATDQRKEQLTEQIPLKRLGTAEDIANAVVFLHSTRGAYCNGTVLNVDGGLWL